MVLAGGLSLRGMGMRLDGYIRRYTTISATLDVLRRRALPLLDPQSWDDRNDRYFMARYKDAKGLQGLYALCAAQCSETYHHWRVFTGAADGACIELRREPLEAALASSPDIRFGDVQYLVLSDVEALKPADLDRLPFVKRHGFAAEEEYRIILESNDPQAAARSIELPLSLIGRVYLNPWLPKPIAESIIATIREIPGCAKLSVQRSHLIDSARWKDAGDIVVGRKPTKRKKAPLKLLPESRAKILASAKRSARRGKAGKKPPA